MNSRFFIDRPIFAWVIALFIVVIGAAAITRLPVAQYPSVAPPAIVAPPAPTRPVIRPVTGSPPDAPGECRDG